MAFVAVVLCFVTSVSFGDISCNCTNGNGASGCYGTPVKDPTGDGNNMSCIYNWSCQNGYYTYPTTTQTSETSYTATCDPIDYGITYYLDGGSWPSNNPTNPSTYNVETQTFTISTPTKTGYVFAGWCEDAALTTNCSQTKTITTGSTGDRAYYAKWSCDTGYHRQNFDFDLNITTEGTSSNYDSNTNTWEVFFGDETPEFTLSGSALCSTYNGNEPATEAQIQAGANPQQADVCWCKLTSYTDNNNTTINPSDQLWVKQGLWYTPASCRQSCATNCAKQVSDNALYPGFARQLFNAANDLCVPDAGTITYNCGQQPGSTTQTGTVPSPQSVEFGGEYDLAANSCAYAGYHFIGWNCSHNLDAGTAPQGGYIYSFDGTAANAPSFTYQVSGNNSAVTCTAQWTPITHTITVNRDGGNGAIVVNNGGTSETVSANSTTFTCNEGDTVTFPGWGADNSLTKTGYVFTGWNEGNTALNAGISCDADRTITAQWAQCTCTDGSHSTCDGTASVSNNTCGYDFTCDAHYDYNGESGGTATASAAGVGTVQALDCSPITYTITFKTGDSVMDTQTCTYGQSVSLNPVSTMSNIPVSSQYGWSFRGWTNVVPAQNPMQPSYTNGQTITCTGDMTLYGIWRRCGTFDYYVNGVTGQSVCMQYSYENTSSTTASEHNVTAPDLSIANSTMHTTYGWDVLGWMLNDSTAVTDPVLTPHTVQSPGVNQLWNNYALYQRSVGITYNGNGADGGSTLDTNCGTQSLSGSSTDANALNCNFASNGYTRTGYTFAGWNTEANGTGISYTAGQHAFPNTNRESNPTLTLYAQWTINQHNVTYAVGNHAASGSSDYVVNNVNYGSTHTVLANTAVNIAPDTGYAFQNWDCGVMGTKTAGNTFTMPDANVTCTAQWNCASGYIWNSGHAACELQTYTVTYDGGDSNNDGTGVTPYETVADDTYAPATNVVLPDGAFTLTGYHITGWDCIETGTNNSVTVTSATANNVTTYSFAMPNANVTCTAQWTPNTYNINYHNTDVADGVSWANQNDNPSTYTYGTGATVGVPSRTGYTFAGWCVGADNCNDYANNVSGYTITTTQTGDVDLYAQWTPNTYNINYHNTDAADGVSWANQNDNPSTYTYGTGATIGVPSRTRYTFAGWCRGTVLCYNYAGTENGYTITTTDFGDIDLYAVWIPHNVNLVWDSNGGTEINTPDSCEFGGTIGNILQPTKTGYSFAGWVLKCWLPDTIVSEMANAWAGRGLDNNSVHTWGGATASTYGITQPGQWGASWNSGDKVLGEAFCSTTSGAPGSTASVIEMTEGVNCWCRLTSYTSNNAEQCDVMPTIWVHNGGASLNIARCKSSCDRACTNSMSGYDVGFRTALVGNNVASP